MYLFSRKLMQKYSAERQEHLCDSAWKIWLFCKILITFAKKQEESGDFHEISSKYTKFRETLLFAKTNKAFSFQP